MSHEENLTIRHEDIVINDEEYILANADELPETPYLANDASDDEMPEELLVCMEEIGLSRQDIEDCEIQVYDEKSRGVVKDSFREGIQCTATYLRTLCYNYGLMQWFFQMEGDESLEEIDDLVDSVYSELLRLSENPLLFPTQEAAHTFWHRLGKSLDILTETRSMAVESHKDHVIRCAEEVEAELYEKMPRMDDSRKPWEQFLHNNAPGADIDTRAIEPEGNIQILPMTALRLLYSLKEIQASVIRGIEAARRARGVQTPYRTDNARDPILLSMNTLSPEGHRRHTQIRLDLLQANEIGSRWRPRGLGITELETLNEDFGQSDIPELPELQTDNVIQLLLVVAETIRVNLLRGIIHVL